MIDLHQLYIVNYCHPSCEPFRNIMRLPKEQAFAKALELSKQNPETTAFYRFADFENYYRLRLRSDAILYDSFVRLGGKPKEIHPLSFVFQGSDYLREWFGNGKEYKIPLYEIPEEDISFTFGDSGSKVEREGCVKLVTKKQLFKELLSFPGTLMEYRKRIEETCHYIEVQLWNDEIIEHVYSRI